jgi:dephospho-CoA kinase
MITVGITGRSGCGKSTVTEVFAEKGIPCADADRISREILQPGSPILPELARRFGADTLRRNEDGAIELDRRLLADRAFATPEGTTALNAITHPEIIRRIREAKRAARAAGQRLFLIDGAVIVGTVCEAECDRLVVVTAPFDTSVARIVQRDGLSPQMAARRLNAQTPQEVLISKADHLLQNNGSLAELRAAAEQLCEQLLCAAARDNGRSNLENEKN